MTHRTLAGALVVDPSVKPRSVPIGLIQLVRRLVHPLRKSAPITPPKAPDSHSAAFGQALVVERGTGPEGQLIVVVAPPVTAREVDVGLDAMTRMELVLELARGVALEDAALALDRRLRSGGRRRAPLAMVRVSSDRRRAEVLNHGVGELLFLGRQAGSPLHRVASQGPAVGELWRSPRAAELSGEEIGLVVISGGDFVDPGEVPLATQRLAAESSPRVCASLSAHMLSAYVDAEVQEVAFAGFGGGELTRSRSP